nr:Tellurite resistance protein tehA [Klebsiella pneumoniae]
MNKTQTPRQVLNLPAGYFGMVLGTIGMGFAGVTPAPSGRSAAALVMGW